VDASPICPICERPTESWLRCVTEPGRETVHVYCRRISTWRKFGYGCRRPTRSGVSSSVRNNRTALGSCPPQRQGRARAPRGASCHRPRAATASTWASTRRTILWPPPLSEWSWPANSADCASVPLAILRGRAVAGTPRCGAEREVVRQRWRVPSKSARKAPAPRARLDKVAAVRRPAGRRTASTLLRLSLALAASR
jgi:hypothetical protein